MTAAHSYMYHGDREKILTISIAAFNASDFVERAIESCLIEDIDALDIIVVNDGSTDDTASIVQQYVNDYPQSIRLINKANGGYGSTINASLELAEGNYFKLLDSDDAYCTNALSNLVSILKTTSVDIAITPYIELRNNNTRVVDQASTDSDGALPFSMRAVPGILSMHSIAFRTSLLREAGLYLPSHRLYTDGLYVTQPIDKVKHAYISHEPVYKYTLGQTGQSVSLESATRHWRDLRDLTIDLVNEYYEASSSTAKSIIGCWLSMNTGQLLRVLYAQTPSLAVRTEIEDIVQFMKDYPEVWSVCRKQNKSFRVLARNPRFSYWLLHIAAKIVLYMQ